MEAMKRPLISVVVPVYNAEKYLDRCIESLLAQTFQEFEVVLVNDGSMDKSSAMCEEYAQRDSRIRVVNQPNRGVAMARQSGIDNIRGVYSIHIDPDDWVEPTMLEEMYAEAIAKSADVVICDFMVEYANISHYAKQRVRKCVADNCLERVMYGRIHGSLCNKLIRSELYGRYKIRFFEGINYCEDYLTCVQLFLQGVSIAYLPKAFYHYDQVVNDSSATRKYTKQTLQTQFRFFAKLQEILQGRKRRALSHVISVIAFDCYSYDALSADEFKEVFYQYRRDFLASRFKLKRRLALYVAALGYLKQIRRIV